MSDFLTRLSTEQRELSEKIEKLRVFINGPKFETIDPVSKALLPAQLDVMTTYNNILCHRISMLS